MKNLPRLLAFVLLILPAWAEPPNIILIFTDDQGYEDVGVFGSTIIRTPRLDQMAAEGLKLTNFYAQPVCGVSRAALMTGSYPIRVAEPGNVKLLHTVPHPEEITMAEVLKSAGYATGLIGKWHLARGGEGPGGFEPATLRALISSTAPRASMATRFMWMMWPYAVRSCAIRRCR